MNRVSEKDATRILERVRNGERMSAIAHHYTWPEVRRVLLEAGPESVTKRWAWPFWTRQQSRQETLQDARGFSGCLLVTLPITIPLALGSLKLLSNGVPFGLGDLKWIVPIFLAFHVMVTGMTLDCVQSGFANPKEPLRDPGKFARGLYLGGPALILAALISLAKVLIPIGLVALFIVAIAHAH